MGKRERETKIKPYKGRKVCLWFNCISILGKCDILVSVMRLIFSADLAPIFLYSPESHLDARFVKYSVNLRLHLFFSGRH